MSAIATGYRAADTYNSAGDSPPGRKMGRRNKVLKSESAEPKPMVFVPDVVTPRGVDCISLLEPCQACGAHWNPGARVEIECEQVPVYHRAFLLEDIIWPVFERYFDERERRDLWDIWPVQPDVLLIWLCPDCYDKAAAQGIKQWAWDWRWDKTREGYVPSEVCREEYDAAEAARAELAKKREAAIAEEIWAASVAADAARARNEATRSPSARAIEAAGEQFVERVAGAPLLAETGVQFEKWAYLIARFGVPT